MAAQPMDDLAFFVALADAGSVSAAAKILGSSPPAVSRQLAAVERRLGVALAERSARRFRLTDEGRLYRDRGADLVARTRDLEAEVSSRGNVARGLLRVAAPTDLGRALIAPALAEFSRVHPNLRIHLFLSDMGVEVSEDLLDVAIRVGLPSDPSTITRKLSEAPMKLCAAPAYLAKNGTPLTVADLARHRCLMLSRRHHGGVPWRYRDPAGTLVDAPTQATLSSNNGNILREWAVAGTGLSLEAGWDVTADLEAGRLVECLPAVPWVGSTLYVTFVAGAPVLPRVRLGVDWLVQVIEQHGYSRPLSV